MSHYKILSPTVVSYDHHLYTENKIWYSWWSQLSIIYASIPKAAQNKGGLDGNRPAPCYIPLFGIDLPWSPLLLPLAVMGALVRALNHMVSGLFCAYPLLLSLANSTHWLSDQIVMSFTSCPFSSSLLGQQTLFGKKLRLKNTECKRVVCYRSQGACFILLSELAWQTLSVSPNCVRAARCAYSLSFWLSCNHRHCHQVCDPWSPQTDERTDTTEDTRIINDAMRNTLFTVDGYLVLSLGDLAINLLLLPSAWSLSLPRPGNPQWDMAKCNDMKAVMITGERGEQRI